MKKQVLVYEIPWLINRIYEESDKLLGKIINTSAFEDRCISGIGEYLSLSSSNKRNKIYLLRLIGRYVKEAEEKFGKEESTLFSSESTVTEDGEIEFDPLDVLANVEEEVITKETAGLLAQDDCRDKAILNYWLIGNTNIAYISRSLARTFGGNDRSHRVYVHRFRESCRNQLRSAI